MTFCAVLSFLFAGVAILSTFSDTSGSSALLLISGFSFMLVGVAFLWMLSMKLKAKETNDLLEKIASLLEGKKKEEGN